MTNSILIIALRLVHVLSAIFWVGSLVFLSIFLLPSLRAAGPAGGAVMQQVIGVRRLPLWLLTSGVLTVASGGALYGIASGGFRSAWMDSGPGNVFGLGGALGFIGLIIGLSVNLPAGRRLTKLMAAIQAAGGPPSAEQAAELQRLQIRIGKATVTTAVIVVLAAAAMASARYVA
jgi:uncharacterized membrane protein